MKSQLFVKLSRPNLQTDRLMEWMEAAATSSVIKKFFLLQSSFERVRRRAKRAFQQQTKTIEILEAACLKKGINFYN
jgi:hypothetical protein